MKHVPVTLPFDISGITFHKFIHGELLFLFRDNLDLSLQDGIKHHKSHSHSFVQCMKTVPDVHAKDILEDSEYASGNNRREVAGIVKPGISSISTKGHPIHAVFANQYPIGPYSALLTPFILENRPQVI